MQHGSIQKHDVLESLLPPRIKLILRRTKRFMQEKQVQDIYRIWQGLKGVQVVLAHCLEIRDPRIHAQN